MGPRFVAAFLAQCAIGGQPDKGFACPTVDTIELRHTYNIGPFDVEWIQMNDAIADACALRIGTPEGTIVYTSSFKFDQTPVDKRLADIARLAQTGDSGVQLLISDSSGAEVPGYTPSERFVEEDSIAASGVRSVVSSLFCRERTLTACKSFSTSPREPGER